MIKKIFYLTLIAGLGLTLLVGISKTKAADTGISLSPLTFDFELKPSAATNQHLIVKNLFTHDLNYTIEIDLFDKISEDGAPLSFTPAAEAGTGANISQWVTYPNNDNTGTIVAKGEKDISLTITAPATAEPGGHYGAIFVKENKTAADGKTELGVATRVGSLILISIPGDVKKTATLTGFNSSKFAWSGPIDFNFKVNNTGSVHYDSAGLVTLEPLWGFFGNKHEIDMGKHTLIPGSTRDYKATWNTRYPFGFYKVTASATDGTGAEMITTTMLYAIPLIIVIPSLIGLIIIILLIIYLRHHLRFVPEQQL